MLDNGNNGQNKNKNLIRLKLALPTEHRKCSHALLVTFRCLSKLTVKVNKQEPFFLTHFQIIYLVGLTLIVAVKVLKKPPPSSNEIMLCTIKKDTWVLQHGATILKKMLEWINSIWVCILPCSKSSRYDIPKKSKLCHALNHFLYISRQTTFSTIQIDCV